MEERIRLILEKEAVTQNAFAALLGIPPASLSSVLTGRTKPTANHVNAIHKAFPKISTDWLMFGEGDMYVSEHQEIQDSAVADVATKVDDVVRTVEPKIVMPEVRYIERPDRKITEIRIFYSDGTFESFSRQDKN